MHPQLARVLSDLDLAHGRLHRLAGALTDGAWAARPAPGCWSPAECVAHLNLTSRAYLPLLRDALARAREVRGAAPRRYRMDAVGWLLSRLVGPMPRLGRLRLGRMKTAAAFVPGGELPRERVMRELDALQAELAETVGAADGLPIDRVTIASPFDARAKYGAYAALVILARHQLRHVEQAEEAARSGGAAPARSSPDHEPAGTGAPAAE